MFVSSAHNRHCFAIVTVKMSVVKPYLFSKNPAKMNKKRKVTEDSSDKKMTGLVSQAKLQLEPDEFRLTRLDYFAAPAAAALAMIWAFGYIGTAVNWDDLLYMSLAQHTTPQNWILNRYGHIYLLKLFFWITGDAIIGGRVFWCFLFAGTLVLIYFCSRILAGKKGYIIGLVAAAFFSMQHVFGKDIGCPLPDFTVMFLVMLGTFVYLAFLNRRGRYSHFIIMLLGLIFFWAVKSKETGVCLGVLFFGLGRDDTGLYTTRRFVKDIGWACAGIVAGCALLMLLDLSFVQDALFSIRPSNIKRVLSKNIQRPSSKATTERIAMSWYTFLTTRALFVPFLLYLLAGWKSPVRSFSNREKMMWIFPLLLLPFISFSRRNFAIIPRYFTPAIAVISIWAAQFFWFKLSGSPLRWKNHRAIARLPVAVFLVLLSFIIALIFIPRIPEFVEYYKLNGPVMGFHNLKYNRLDSQQIFYILMIMPVAITVLLIVATMSKKRGLVALFFSWLCLFLLILPPLNHNLTSLKQRIVAQKGIWRFEPCRVFKDQFQFDENTKILISKDIHARSWMLGRNAKAHCHMFNIFYNQKLDYDQFIDGTWDDILKADYTYALLTARDWQGISKKYNIKGLLENYELKTNERAVYRTRSGPMRLILLKKR